MSGMVLLDAEGAFLTKWGKQRKNSPVICLIVVSYNYLCGQNVYQNVAQANKPSERG